MSMLTSIFGFLAGVRGHGVRHEPEKPNPHSHQRGGTSTKRPRPMRQRKLHARLTAEEIAALPDPYHKRPTESLMTECRKLEQAANRRKRVRQRRAARPGSAPRRAGGLGERAAKLLRGWIARGAKTMKLQARHVTMTWANWILILSTASHRERGRLLARMGG